MTERLTSRTLDLEVQGSSLARHAVSLDKELYSSLSLFTRVYNWAPATYCWGRGGGGEPCNGLSSHPKCHGIKLERSSDPVGLWLVCAFTFTYGISRGHSLILYARFLGKKRNSLYISREKGDHYYIQTRYKDLFFPITIFSLENLKKIGPKSARK